MRLNRGAFRMGKGALFLAAGVLILLTILGGASGVQRNFYKISNSGSNPPKDHFIATCSVIIENPLFSDVKFFGGPACSYSGLVDVYECANRGLEPLNFLPFGKDDGKVDMRADTITVSSKAYSIPEGNKQAMEFKQCVNGNTKELSFHIIDTNNNLKDSKVVAVR